MKWNLFLRLETTRKQNSVHHINVSLVCWCHAGIQENVSNSFFPLVISLCTMTQSSVLWTLRDNLYIHTLLCISFSAGFLFSELRFLSLFLSASHMMIMVWSVPYSLESTSQQRENTGTAFQTHHFLKETHRFFLNRLIDIKCRLCKQNLLALRVAVCVFVPVRPCQTRAS